MLGRRVAQRLVPVVVLLGLTACSGSDGAPAPTSATTTPAVPTTSATTPAPTTLAPTPGDTLTPGGTDDGSASPTTVQKGLCAFLVKEEPKLTGAKNERVALFANDIAAWVTLHPTYPFGSTAAIDDASRAGCPSTRTAVLKKLGGTSFEAVFAG